MMRATYRVRMVPRNMIPARKMNMYKTSPHAALYEVVKQLKVGGEVLRVTCASKMKAHTLTAAYVNYTKRHRSLFPKVYIHSRKNVLYFERLK